MMNVLITRRKTTFEKSLFKAFEREGYKVFSTGSNEPDDKIDIYIDVSDERDINDTFMIRDGLDEKVINKVYKANVIKPMKMFEKFLPLLDAGEGKRVCFLTSAGASINETRDVNGYAYNLSKAALHNFIQMASNRLTPSGYTWRIFDPMPFDVDAAASVEAAFNYFTRRRGTENDDPLRNDENRLVFRDALGREHTW